MAAKPMRRQDRGLGSPGSRRGPDDTVADEVVRLAARAGRIMLENGSETNRVQDTVNATGVALVSSARAIAGRLRTRKTEEPADEMPRSSPRGDAPRG